MILRSTLFFALLVAGTALWLPVARAFEEASEGSSTEAYDLKIAAGALQFDEQQLERLVDLLGSNKFRVRSQASKQIETMIEQDFRIADVLRKYTSHPDLEVRLTLKEVLDPLGSELKWIDPATEEQYMSGSSTYNGVSLDFKNMSKQPIKIFWIDRSGERQAWRTVLKPGKGYHCEKTFESHVWLITDVKEKALGLYVVGNQNSSILFRGVPQQPAKDVPEETTRKQ